MPARSSSGLNAAVLAGTAMQGQKHHIRVAEVEGGRRQRQGCAAHPRDLRVRRRRRGDRGCQQFPLLCDPDGRSRCRRRTPDDQERANRNDLRRTRDRDIAFFARSAEQHGNFHVSASGGMRAVTRIIPPEPCHEPRKGRALELVDNPLRREPQLRVAAHAKPPRSALALMQQVVHGDGGLSIFEKARQDSLLIAADQNEARIARQWCADIVAKCRDEESAGIKTHCNRGEKRCDAGLIRQMGQRIAHAHDDIDRRGDVCAKVEQVCVDGADRERPGARYKIFEQGIIDVDRDDRESAARQRDGMQSETGAQIDRDAAACGAMALLRVRRCCGRGRRRYRRPSMYRWDPNDRRSDPRSY